METNEMTTEHAPAAHTPEPWERNGANGIHKRISANYSTCIATTHGDNREANADRVFDCVMALAGMNPAAVRDVVSALEDITGALALLLSADGHDASKVQTVANARTALAALNSTTPRALTLDEARAKVEAMVPKGCYWGLDDECSRNMDGVKRRRYYTLFYTTGVIPTEIFHDSLPSALAWFERVISERGAK